MKLWNKDRRLTTWETIVIATSTETSGAAFRPIKKYMMPKEASLIILRVAKSLNNIFSREFHEVRICQVPVWCSSIILSVSLTYRRSQFLLSWLLSNSCIIDISQFILDSLILLYLTGFDYIGNIQRTSNFFVISFKFYIYEKYRKKIKRNMKKRKW